jgi:hypothetical protein
MVGPGREDARWQRLDALPPRRRQQLPARRASRTHFPFDPAMPNLIAALGAVLLAALGFLPSDTLPAGFATGRNAALTLLTAYLAWQAFALLRQGAPRREPATAAPAATAAAATPVAAGVAVPAPAAAPGGDALILLSLLQERGRFLDFVAEDIAAYSDAQVAAASRVVHQGCRAVIDECLAPAPAYAGAEGERITVDPAADPNRYRLQGKVAQQPPYSGVVVHRGWKTTRLALPRHTRPIDPTGENVIAPVDVEVR